MTSAATFVLIPLIVVGVLMAAENQVSRRNERILRRRGAVEPQDDVYRVMQLAYPVAFVVMLAEGALCGPAPVALWSVGAAVFVLAKGLKCWAIMSLGGRWTFRVLVPADEPLVTAGPYRWMTHPNYVAVVGELVGVALMMRAVVTGPLAVVGFGALIVRRIAVENRALGRL